MLARLIAGALVVLSVSPATAQLTTAPKICEPAWGPPLPVYRHPASRIPYPGPHVPYPAAWPPPPVDGNQTVTTAYGPAVDGDSLTDAATVLQSIPGAVRVIVPEAFLNRLIARSDTDTGPVTDFILGANVTGNQNTQTTLTVDVQPSDETARVMLDLNGVTLNETVGVTPQAAVRSRGQYQFRLTKQVDFNGQQFTTRTPAAWVTPQLMTEGAATNLSGVPILGPIANRIAFTEAERRKPVSEQIIAQRVTQQVAPRFNSDVDCKLSEANVALQQYVPRALERLGLSASDLSLTSTDDRIRFGLMTATAPSPVVPSRSILPSGTLDVPHETNRPLLPAPLGEPTAEPNSDPGAAPVDDDGYTIIRQISHRVIRRPDSAASSSVSVVESRGIQPPPSMTEGTAFTVAIHENAINSLLGRLPIDGAEVPDTTIHRVLDGLTGGMAGSSLGHLTLKELGREKPEFAAIVLGDDRPIVVRFEQDEIRIVVRAGFKPLMTPEVPTQRVEIPFTLRHEDGRLTLQPGAVTVASLPGAEPSPIVELAQPIIRQQVTDRLQPVPLPTTLPFRLPEASATALTIRQVTLANGWLLIAVD